MDRLGDHRGRRAAATGAMDSGADEGSLEAADRRDGVRPRVAAELQADQSGTPGGMVALQLAGDAKQIAGARGDRAAQAMVVGGQAL
jgi:hypothetical protein